MLDFLDGVAGPGYGAAILWTLAALVLLVIVLIVVKMIRSLTFGTFVAGGRNRKTRLAVMDATAVDSHRRLVLVRRDDIEHLLLIGGPTDVVVERDIKLSAARRPNLTTDGAQTQPAAAVRTPGAAPQQPVQQQARQGILPPQAAALPPRATPVAAPRPAAPIERSSPAGFTAAPKPADTFQGGGRKLPAAGSEAIDESLVGELAIPLGDTHPHASTPQPGRVSLDDEMTKLLGELSSLKK